MNIDVAPVNDAPEAADDSFNGTENSEIEGNLLADNGNGADFDIDGDNLQVVSDMITSAQGGSVIIMGNGDFVYMPPADYFGADSFEYTVLDGQGGSDIGTANITLAPSNEAPVAREDAYEGFDDQTIVGNVLDDNGSGADFDPDGDPLTVQAAVLATANGGMVTIAEDGSFAYTPAIDFTGEDSFDYTLTDGRGGQDTGTVTLTVNAVAADIIGTEGNDKLKGTNGDDVILGLGGHDKIHGKKGNDDISGGNGNDRLYGQNGDDVLNGGAGSDKLFGQSGDDVLIGGPSHADQILTEKSFSTDNVTFPKLLETVDIHDLVPPGDPALGIISGDLSVEYQTEATVSFVKTVAGFNNTLGFYSIDQDGTIQNAEIAFENVKKFDKGDEATIELSGTPNTDFGFFIIADGYDANHRFKHMDFEDGELEFFFGYGTAGERQATINDDGENITLVFTDHRGETVIEGAIYHTTARGGDTNLNADGKVHAISGLVEGEGTDTLRIGFEDLPNTGDADYNDVVFDLTVQPQFSGTIDSNDILKGGAGDDVLIGGGGDDRLWGNSGADTFKFGSIHDGIDTIEDFKSHQGDKIDIADVLTEEFDPVQDILSQFVEIERSGKRDAVLKVDADGAGTEHEMTAIAIIENGKNLDAQEMYDQGSLIL